MELPRAEVMISFRPANDETHIAQLLGVSHERHWEDVFLEMIY